jgi:hypothetical protein
VRFPAVDENMAPTEMSGNFCAISPHPRISEMPPISESEIDSQISRLPKIDLSIQPRCTTQIYCIGALNNLSWSSFMSLFRTRTPTTADSEASREELCSLHLSGPAGEPCGQSAGRRGQAAHGRVGRGCRQACDRVPQGRHGAAPVGRAQAAPRGDGRTDASLEQGPCLLLPNGVRMSHPTCTNRT